MHSGVPQNQAATTANIHYQQQPSNDMLTGDVCTDHTFNSQNQMQLYINIYIYICPQPRLSDALL